MSSMPPNMPPSSSYPPPHPPYDAKTQWKAYRAQQKAAWRTQREAWKARYLHAYGPQVPSIVGPILLMTVGIVALLLMSGRIDANHFWGWYGHWWPMMLIGAGVLMLAEWAIDLRRPYPVRRGGNLGGLFVLLAIVGICASAGSHWGQWHGNWGDNWGDQGENFFNHFGLPEHDLDPQPQYAQVPANAVVEIQNPRGDVSLRADNVSTIEVVSHQEAFASSDAEAKTIFDSEATQVTASGSAILVKTEGNAKGRVNLTITVPKTARVNLNAGKGDVTVAGLGAGLHLNARGDAHLSAISGAVELHFTDGRHDLSAQQIDGDVSINGDCSDVTLSEIKGRVTQNGEIQGDVHMEKIAGALRLHTSVTDLQIAELPGDLTLDSDNLRVAGVHGPVRVETHSKDVDLSEIAGDSYVDNRDGRVAITPSGSYGIEARNHKGDVEVTLPSNISATVEAHSHNGDIVSDFAMPNHSEGADKIAAFRIGSGGPRVQLSAENGDVHIKRGGATVAEVPRLRPSRLLSAHPVTQ